MDDDLTEYPTQRIRLQQCQICGRKFNTESLKKHQTICRKIATNKRKIFDAGKQRAKDSDVPYKATKKTMQIYTGEAPAQDNRSRSKSKPNWREKHQQLIRSIREARQVTRAMKEGGPLPAFRPSEVPSDYVSCPYCRRNFNEHVAQRHIPFCQTQHQRKQPQPQPSRSNQQIDRGRTLPPQHSSAYKQQSSNSGMYSNPHDVYNNGYKHSNSAPMIVRQGPSESQRRLPPRKTNDGNGWGGFRKLFGMGSKEDPRPSANYYSPEDEDDYEPPVRRPVQQPVLMRTGRTQENTGLNVRARQKNDETNSYMRRVIPPPVAPPSYNQTRSHYGNGQYSSTRPTAVGRAPPPQSSGIRCGECGSVFNNATARYCPQCGSRR